MVKSVLGVNHQGLTEWLLQRVTAIVMAIYSTVLVVFLLTHTGLTFDDWHPIFAHVWVKIATLIFLVSLLYHAWIGMWTVFTDYVKCFVVRLTLHVIVLLALVAFFFEGALILWSA